MLKKNQNIIIAKTIVLFLLLTICYCFYDTECSIAVSFIRFIHLLFILFMILGPFIFNTKLSLLFYIMISIFTMLHWIVVNDTCALTLIEQFLTGRKSDDTFIGKIVKPVYNISNKQITKTTIFLLIIAIMKLIFIFLELKEGGKK
jgi:hypothetical protein